MRRVRYYVVSADLDSGSSIRVSDLENMKDHLMAVRRNREWRLVISIHGNESVLSVRGGDLGNRQAKGVYGADEITKLFIDDADFARWRSAHGPYWTTLNACQVNLPFERIILSAFNKPDSRQRAQGLGSGCRPHTNVDLYYPNNSNTALTKREQLRRLPREERQNFLTVLLELNRTMGYFGGPPVSEALLQEYYFDEPVKGAWPRVTVSHQRNDTGISYYNRTQNARFLGQLCTQHLGPQRGRSPRVPDIE